MKSLATSAQIERSIYVIRNHAVMLDSDLAELYGVSTGVLNQAVKRNLKRFPEDFSFILNRNEIRNLKSQFVISSWGGRRKLPSVFTEQGVAMLSSVLNSDRAIQVNIQIMRAFIRLKGFQLSYGALRKEIRSMRRKYDENFTVVFDAIGRLLDGPEKKFRVKGFSQIKKGSRFLT